MRDAPSSSLNAKQFALVPFLGNTNIVYFGLFLGTDVSLKAPHCAQIPVALVRISKR